MTGVTIGQRAAGGTTSRRDRARRRATRGGGIMLGLRRARTCTSGSLHPSGIIRRAVEQADMQEGQ